MEHLVAVDIGGTKLAAGVVDRAGSLVARASTPTSDAARAGGEALFGALCALVDDVVDRTGVAVRACGVGCGGPMTRDGVEVSPLNIPAWRDFPLRARLADHIDVPVHVDNDAKALALGEGWLGRAAGVSDFVAMVVSTGVGGGIVVDGRLLDGAAGNAGHIGHLIVEPGGRPCACGARGCLEAEASGTGIAAATGRPASEADADTVERTGTIVGRAVASVANLLDIGLTVVAGSVALGFGEPFFAAAQAEIDRSARLSFSTGTMIRPAGLGDDGPLVGAAAVAWRAIGADVGVR